MKTLLTILLALTFSLTQAQSALKITEENDFFDIRGHGTDQQYTNGTFINFIQHKDSFNSFVNKPLIRPSKNYNTTVEWGIGQLMYTSNDIRDSSSRPFDVGYAGALFVNHTIVANDEVKQFGTRTQVMLGVIGPDAFGKETQTLIHRWIHYYAPLGWKWQGVNAPVINLNLGFDKTIFGLPNRFEAIGSVDGYVGTLYDGASASCLLRAGILENYFKPAIERNLSKKFNIYLVLKPKYTYMLHNSIYQGSFFVPLNEDQKTRNELYPMRNGSFSVSYGLVFGFKYFSASYVQRKTSRVMDSEIPHSYGQIQVMFKL